MDAKALCQSLGIDTEQADYIQQATKNLDSKVKSCEEKISKGPKASRRPLEVRLKKLKSNQEKLQIYIQLDKVQKIINDGLNEASKEAREHFQTRAEKELIACGDAIKEMPQADVFEAAYEAAEGALDELKLAIIKNEPPPNAHDADAPEEATKKCSDVDHACADPAEANQVEPKANEAADALSAESSKPETPAEQDPEKPKSPDPKTAHVPDPTHQKLDACTTEGKSRFPEGVRLIEGNPLSLDELSVSSSPYSKGSAAIRFSGDRVLRIASREHLVFGRSATEHDFGKIAIPVVSHHPRLPAKSVKSAIGREHFSVTRRNNIIEVQYLGSKDGIFVEEQVVKEEPYRLITPTRLSLFAPMSKIAEGNPLPRWQLTPGFYETDGELTPAYVLMKRIDDAMEDLLILWQPVALKELFSNLSDGWLVPINGNTFFHNQESTYAITEYDHPFKA